MDKPIIEELLALAKKINAKLRLDVINLAKTQRLMVSARARAAKREGQILKAIIGEKARDGQSPLFTKEERPAELAIRLVDDPERTAIEEEIAELTIKRERQAVKVETNRNDIKLLMLEIRAALQNAGEPPYQPASDES